ncbi:MAG: head GIN domain-containing protein [Chitinophagaceae bacterium]
MKKIYSIVALLLFSGITLFAQKVINDANAEKRSVTNFHGVEVSGGIDLYISQGEESVAVSANEAKFRDRIKTEVKNGVLKIWYESDKKIDVEWKSRKLKAYVSFKRLDLLEASGGSDVLVEGSIKSDVLTLNVSGGSDFEGKVQVNDMKVDASGGSDVKISGAAAKLAIEASGGSDLIGYELATEFCNVHASGGSDIQITVTKELLAEASGGSDVHYKGDASVKEMKSSGSSSIKKTSK